MTEWFSIEVSDGSSSAREWLDRYGDHIINAAQREGLADWEMRQLPWGVVIELELTDEFVWEQVRSHPAVGAALDAVPDPVRGLLVHRGRGGSAGSRLPLVPRPFTGSGALALPIPFDEVTRRLARGDGIDDVQTHVQEA